MRTMARFFKKYSSFLMWVCLPSLLLVISVFGINTISRPVMGGAQCNSVQDCVDLDPNACRQWDCIGNACVPLGIDRTVLGCGVCNADSNCSNRNGVCDFDTEANCTSLGDDCGGLVPGGVCDGGCSGNSQDFCCNTLQGCGGTDSTTTLFDIDCVCCGDSAVNSLVGEQCDPSGSACSVPGDGAGTCDAQCQCTPNPPQCGNGIVETGEQREPPNTATCSATCQNIVIVPTCGDGVINPGEDCEGTTCNFTNTDGTIIPGVCQACVCIPECQTEGSGCGDDGTIGSGVCFPGTGGGTGGSSLIPVGVHTGVFAQWFAAFAVPGAAFVGVKVRRR